MECRFCPRRFPKPEHLRRHERSHTGAKPFACSYCQKPFSRQDSLQRHQRLHTRGTLNANVETPVLTPSESEASLRNACDNLVSNLEPTSYQSHLPLSPQQSPHLPPLQQQTHQNSVDSAPFQQTLYQDDLDFDLIWPDNEQLFQSILSTDALTWQMPLGTLPSPPQSVSVSNINSHKTAPLDVRPPALDGIPVGGNHQALHDVSTMVANLSSSVAVAADATNFTSRFLDECLHMFFARFTPTMPIMHRANFVFRDCTQPLLLNAIAVGSLYLGPKDSVTKGETLWRLAHTAVATSWQTLITHRGPYDACAGVQLILTSVLSQIYGMLSKNRSIRAISRPFHNISFSWARQCGMFEEEPFEYDCSNLEQLPLPGKEKAWRVWTAREVQKRSLLAMYMLDGLNAQMSGDTTSERHLLNQLTLPGSETAFEASGVDEWAYAMKFQHEEVSYRKLFQALFSPYPDETILARLDSQFSFRIVLEGVQSLLFHQDEDVDMVLGMPSNADIRRALSRIHDQIVNCASLAAEDRLETLMRWHALCLDMLTRGSTLTRNLCAKYTTEQHLWTSVKRIKTPLDLGHWAASETGMRALLHAISIQDIVEKLPRGRAHTIHMPISLFAAATVYAVFSSAGYASVKLPSVVDWKQTLRDNDESGDTGAGQGDTALFIKGTYRPACARSATTRNLLYELNSMDKLFRCLATQWGVSAEMELVVGQWITQCH